MNGFIYHYSFFKKSASAIAAALVFFIVFNALNLTVFCEHYIYAQQKRNIAFSAGNKLENVISNVNFHIKIMDEISKGKGSFTDKEKENKNSDNVYMFLYVLAAAMKYTKKQAKVLNKFIFLNMSDSVYPAYVKIGNYYKLPYIDGILMRKRSQSFKILLLGAIIFRSLPRGVSIISTIKNNNKKAGN